MEEGLSVAASERLASALGRRGQAPNVAVARDCLARPELLAEIVTTLKSGKTALVADAAEVLTKVAEARPELVAPHLDALLPLIEHKNGRVRWEAAHALALATAQAPRRVAKELPRFARIAREDESVIVRDYVLDAIAAYGSSGKKAAGEAFPVLAAATASFASKHAARILRALPTLVEKNAALRTPAVTLARRFVDHERPGIRKEASRALKRLATE